MANLRDIKKRINSVESTKQITRTMEMVATAKIRRATERVNAANPYSDSIYEVLGKLAGHVSDFEHPLLEHHEEEKHVLAIVIASDRGLAGGFNTNVLRSSEHFMNDVKAAGKDVDIIGCGKKALVYFGYRKVVPVLSFRDLSADPTLDEARAISKYIIEEYAAGRLDAVHLIYNHARNAADQDLMNERILPIGLDFVPASEAGGTQASQGAGAGSSEASGSEYEFSPDAETILAKLLPLYVETEVYRALIDSAAAEQGARRKAMQAATDNAIDMINTLTRAYNRARQTSITTEITEIVGGADALEDNS